MKMALQLERMYGSKSRIIYTAPHYDIYEGGQWKVFEVPNPILYFTHQIDSLTDGNYQATVGRRQIGLIRNIKIATVSTPILLDTRTC